jgi:flagellar biosynthesis protein FlhB
MASQKTEQPTQKRLNEARRQGRFPISRDLLGGVQLFLFVWLITRDSAVWLDTLRRIMRRLLEAAFERPSSAGDMQALAGSLALPLLWPAVQMGAWLVAGTLVLQLVSTGFGVSPSRLSPDFTRLNGFARLAQLPKQNASQALQALIALPIFAYLISHVLAEHGPGFARLSASAVPAAMASIGSAMSSVLWQGAWLLLLLGLFDYYRQRSRWDRELKMSKQEVKDENKESEGSPHIKARIRRLMRSRSRRRMMKDVETATAVVVNPTHYAVALRYDSGQMQAPRVVAKGKNFLAARIRERARRFQVPIVENPPLARSLHQAAAVGQEIPAHLFRAVAEVLAYIYRVMNPGPRVAGPRP